MIQFVSSRSVAIALLVSLFACPHVIAADLTPLLADASENKDWAALGQLLDSKSNINATQPDGMTALHWAVYWGNSDAAQKLVSANADVNAETAYKVTPLSIACTSGDAALVKLLVDAGAKLDHRLPGNETPLMTASRTGERKAVQYLIDGGAELDAKDHRGQTALMWAAAEGNVDAVDALLDAGADPNLSIKSGFTATLFAARHGRIGAVKRLLEAGVDVNDAMKPANTSGRNPRSRMSALLLAVESGHFEMAVELVKAGADPNDQRSGYGPLHALAWVRRANRGDGVDGDPPPRGSGKLTSLEFVRVMVANGADVNLQLRRGSAGKAGLHPQGGTPFLFAAKRCDLQLMELLEELGADLHRPNKDGCTPLMAAAGVGVTAVDEHPGTPAEVIATIQWLVDRGGDVNTVDKNLETPMHGAAYRTFPDVVDFLADLGADPETWNHKNKHGWTPKKIAQGYRPGSFKPSPETIAAIERAAKESANQ